MNNLNVKHVAMCIFLFMFSNLTIASPPEMIGTGSLSCGSWYEAREKKNEMQKIADEQWVAGFLSGHNYYNAEKRRFSVDLPTITLWLDTYCKANPTHAIYHAAIALASEMSGVKAPYTWNK